ncbi:unnamed protein product [Pylaiella littoralis]
MRLLALTLLLSSRSAWSFQIGSPPPSWHHRGPSRHGGAFSTRSSGVSRRSGRTMCSSPAVLLALGSVDGPRPKTCQMSSSSSSSSSGSGNIEAVVPPSGALKGVVAGFVAAVFVLAADPGTALADATPFPTGAPGTTSAAPEEVVREEVVPTVKLEGELAAQFQKAQSAGSVQQFDKAKNLYNQVVKYAPGYVYGWSNRANVLIAEGDLQGAVRDYDRALELAEGVSMPDKWIIHLNRGTTLMALGEDDRAMADFNQAARLNNSKDLFTLANRAQAFERKGDWAKALADYEGAINVQPGNVQPWWIRYALVLFQEGRDFDSLAFLKRVQAKFEGVGEIQAAMTAIEFGRGNMKEATKAWKGINVVDQQMYLKDAYLKDKLKWPPRMVESLKAFDTEKQQADARPVDGSPPPPPTAAATAATATS